MKSSGIGGQAVLEGVMMRNKNRYAVAVRKPDGEIAVEKGECTSLTEKYKILGLPIIRGVVSFVESLVLGMKMLTSSAAYFEEEEEPGKFERWLQKKFGEKADKFIMGCTVFFSILLAVAIFMLLPLVVVSFIDESVVAYEWKTLIEGLLRVAIFLGYVVIISQLKDIRRVFMYHGAEHKTINCIEKGMAPTVQNVRKCSRLHKRCGTSFLLFVMLISVVFFLLVRVETLWLRFVVRILFVPVIAGISYEFIRLAGSSESKFIGFLSKPGMWLQGFTTREPNDDMIRVAVASVEAVFDWQAYIDENFDRKIRKKNGRVKTVPAGKKVAAAETKKTVAEEEKAAVAEPMPAVEEPVAPVAPAVSEALVPETAPVQEETQAAVETAAAVETPVQEKVAEPEDITAKFDWSFPKNKEEEPDEAVAKASRSRLVEKVAAADKAEEAGKAALKAAPVSRDADDEDEDDEILRALDKFFVFEGEGTVMERSGDK